MDGLSQNNGILSNSLMSDRGQTVRSGPNLLGRISQRFWWLLPIAVAIAIVAINSSRYEWQALEDEKMYADDSYYFHVKRDPFDSWDSYLAGGLNYYIPWAVSSAASVVGLGATSPDAFLVLCRVLLAASQLAVCALSFATVRLAGGSRAVGAASAFLYILSPFYLTEAYFYYPDFLCMPFALASLYLAARYRVYRSWQMLVLSAVAAGCAASTKYVGVAVFLFPGLAWFMTTLEALRQNRHSLVETLKTPFLQGAAFSLAFGLTILACNPRFLTVPHKYKAGVLYHVKHYVEGHGYSMFSPYLDWFSAASVPVFYANVLFLGVAGLMAPVLVAVGAWRLWFGADCSRTSRYVVAASAAIIAFFMVSVLRHEMALSRNVAFLVPCGTILMSFGLAGLVKAALALRQAPAFKQRAAGLASVAALLLLSYEVAAANWLHYRDIATVPAREQMIRWTQANLPPSNILWVDRTFWLGSPIGARHKVTQFNFVTTALDELPRKIKDENIDYLAIGGWPYDWIIEGRDRYSERKGALVRPVYERLGLLPIFGRHPFLLARISAADDFVAKHYKFVVGFDGRFQGSPFYLYKVNP